MPITFKYIGRGVRVTMTGIILRLVMLAAGIVQVMLMIFALARRSLSETLVFLWGVESVLFILVSILINPQEIESYISVVGLIILILIAFGILFWAWHISIEVSSLIKKNLELGMQVSLLNEEREVLSEEIKRLKQECVDNRESGIDGAKEDTIRN